MHSWKDLMTPQKDIISQKFNESIFTAALDDIIAKREKNPIYSDPNLFFENTHITNGLKRVIIQVFSALKGKKEGNNVIELRTTFGGGKTHSLISLYHIANNPKIFEKHAAFNEIKKEFKIPSDIKICLASLIGSRINVSKKKFIEIDGKKTELKTWFGEMAYQLGGEEAFKILMKNDEAKSAPGKDTLHELFDFINNPSLILMDEAVQYLVSLVGIDRHLYDETVQFIQQLIEVIAKRDECAYIFTLPDSAIECINKDGENAQQILDKTARELETRKSNEALAKTKKVTERGKTVIQPVEYVEIFDIIRKRIFKKIDPMKRIEIQGNIEQLWKKYFDWGNKFLPDKIFKTAGEDLTYKEKMIKSYPFHPALIDVFYDEWGAHAHFQRTRAILRIFAKIIYHFWKADKEPTLINCGDLPFEIDVDIRSELLTYMGPNFESVINTDIKRCKHLEDKFSGDYSKWQVYSRLFRTVFLHSLPVAGRTIGVTEKTLILESVHYNMTPTTFKDALSDMRENLFHFFKKGSKFTILFEINLNAMIVDETEFVKPDDVEIFLKNNMSQISPKTHPIINWPEDSKDIPEKFPKSNLPSLIFVACSLDLPTMKMTLDSNTEKKIQEWATMRGNSPRVNKNGLFFILMNKGLVAELENNVKRYLAMLSIISKIEEKDSQVQLTQEQIVEIFNKINELYPDSKITLKLKKFDSKAKLPNLVRGKIIEQLHDSYSHVAHWNGKSFEQFEIASDKFELVSRAQDTLNREGLVMDQFAPGYISKQIGEIISTESFWKNFFQISGETLPLNVNSIQNSLSKAIEQGKLAIAISNKSIPNAIDSKPDDFPLWVYENKIHPEEIRINSSTYLIPSEIADKIVSNGQTAPDQPELYDIGELNPYDNKVKLIWKAVPKSLSYKLFRDIKSFMSTENLKPIFEGKLNSYIDSLDTPGFYYYSVVALNEFGVSKQSKLKSIDYKTDYPPEKPFLNEIALEPIKHPEITLNWEKTNGAEKYKLFKSKKLINKIEDCIFIFEGNHLKYNYILENLGTYYFAVIGINRFGNSELSNCRGVTYGTKQPPIAPILKIRLLDDDKTIECNWNKVINANKFKLYREKFAFTEKSGDLHCLIEDNLLTFKDKPMNGTFYYAVIAENEDGESVFSNCENITIGSELSPVEIELEVKPDFLDDFIDEFGEIISNLISLGAEPSIKIRIQGILPTKISKIAKNSLHNKILEKIEKSKIIINNKINWNES